MGKKHNNPGYFVRLEKRRKEREEKALKIPGPPLVSAPEVLKGPESEKDPPRAEPVFSNPVPAPQNAEPAFQKPEAAKSPIKARPFIPRRSPFRQSFGHMMEELKRLKKQRKVASKLFKRPGLLKSRLEELPDELDYLEHRMKYLRIRTGNLREIPRRRLKF